MTAFDAKNALKAKAAGSRLGRKGMARAVIQAVAEFDGSYKGAMNLVGRLKAIAQAAKADRYWTEKVDDGYHAELHRICNSPLTDEAKLRRSQALDELGALDGEELA